MLNRAQQFQALSAVSRTLPVADYSGLMNLQHVFGQAVALGLIMSPLAQAAESMRALGIEPPDYVSHVDTLIRSAQ